MTALVRYEAARNALAEAHRVDEVKDIRDKAEAMAAYARQAKDSDLIKYATEIKVRAERRAGQMLRESAERGERATKESGINQHRVSNDATPTLTDIGITRDQSSRWQALAAMPDEHFETAVETAKETAGEVTTAHMLRAARGYRPKQTKTAKKAIERLKHAPNSALAAWARQVLDAVREGASFTPDEKEVLTELRDALVARLTN